MTKEPEASNSYYANKARWNILNKTRGGGGRSVDTPTWYKRKWPVRLVHIDAIQDNSGKDLSEALLPAERRVSLDEYVLQKIDWERFSNTLSLKGFGYLRMRMVFGLTDKEASERMDVSIDHLRCMQKSIRNKLEKYRNVSLFSALRPIVGNVFVWLGGM